MPATPRLRSILRHSGLALVVIAVIGFVWWIDGSPAEPRVDRTVETDTARRARLEALLDREVTVVARDELRSELITRVCESAGVRVSFLRSLSRSTGDPALQAPDTLSLTSPVTINLPHPIRLRSALELLAPSGVLSFVGNELLIGDGSNRMKRSLRVHPVALKEDQSLLWLGSHHTYGDSRRFLVGADFLCTIDYHQRGHLQDLQATLEGMASRSINHTVQIGETAAGRQRREQIESALEQPLELEIDPPQRLLDVLGQLQTRLGVNIHVDVWEIESEGVDPQSLVSCSTRVSARSALRRILDGLGLTYVVEHDCVLVTTPVKAQERLSLGVYPVSHLQDAPEVGAPVDLLEIVTHLVEPRAWDEGGGDFGFHQHAAVILQSEQIHQEIQRTLDTLAQTRHPARLLGAEAERPFPPVDPWEVRLQQPGVPIPGPLTLAGLAEHLNKALDKPVQLDLRPSRNGDVVRVLPGGRPDYRPGPKAAIPGDDGQGTLEEQLVRLLGPVEEDILVQHDNLLITSLLHAAEAETAEYHAVPQIADDRPFPVRLRRWVKGYVSGDPAREDQITRLLVLSAFRTPSLCSTPVPGGMVARLSRAGQARLRRQLTPGHPARETLSCYLHGPRAERAVALDRALRSNDPKLVSLAVWLVDDDLFEGLWPALIAAFRSGVLVNPEVSMPEAAMELWELMKDKRVSSTELAAGIRELAIRNDLTESWAETLQQACNHREGIVRRAAVQALGSLPPGGHLLIDANCLLKCLGDPATDSEARDALTAHALARVSQLDDDLEQRLGALDWMWQVQSRFPLVNDLLKAHYVERGIGAWNTRSFEPFASTVEVLLEMLDDERPEHRILACRALALWRNPSQEAYERMKLQTGDPLAGKWAEAALKAWDGPKVPAEWVQ